MRSQLSVPLKEQDAEFETKAEIFEEECDAEEHPVLQAFFIDGLLDEAHYKHQPDLHPANIVGLAAATPARVHAQCLDRAPYAYPWLKCF